MRTLLVTLGCLLGATWGSYLLYQDFHTVGGGSGEVMAQVGQKDSKVRRKAASTYVWSSVNPSEPLFRHDSVQTGEKSRVTIQYRDGSVVELGENSLVEIDDLNNLSLNFGSLLVKRSDGIDRQITVGSDGKTQIKDLVARLLEPAPLKQFFVGKEPTHAVEFSWKVLKQLPATSLLHVEYSTNEKFENAQTLNTTKADLKPARYYWRLADQTGPLTPSSSFIVAEVLPLKPVWPNSSEKVLSFGENATQFRWQTLDLDLDKLHTGRHQIEVAQDAAFKKVIYKEAVEPSSGFAELKKLGEGSYFWRISSTYNDVSLVSATESFSMEKGKRVSIELLKPDQDSALQLGSDVRFNWKSSADAVQYAWEFEKTPGVLTEKKINSNALDWTADVSGAHRWRVKAVTPQGQVLGESEWRTLALFTGSPVQLESPKAGEIVRYWEAPGQLQVRWKSDRSDTQKYQLEVATDSDFKQVKFQKATDAESLSSRDLALLPDGSYFWRVRQLDSGGNLVKSSSVQSFTYGIYPPLSSPVVQEPQDQATFTLLEKDLDTTLKWTPEENAEKYELSIYPVKANRVGRILAQDATPALQKVIKDPSYHLKDLPVGEYEWVVRSVDRLGRKGDASAPRRMTVTYGEPLSAPEPTTPEVQ